MGNPYWMGTMMGHAWNLLLLGLGIGMGRERNLSLTLSDFEAKLEELQLTALGDGSTTPTIEENQVLTEILGITISVECVPKPRGKNETPDLQRRQEKSKIICGSGYKCDANSCGSGAEPASVYKHPTGSSGGSQCKSFENVQCN